MLIRVEPDTTSCQNVVVEGLQPDDQQPQIDWLHSRPAWIRHSVYWAFALGVIALCAFDVTTAAPSDDSSGKGAFILLVGLVVVVIGFALAGLLLTLRQWEQVGAARTTGTRQSRRVVFSQVKGL